ncbi:hypothetical protein NDU88_002675 [Pleurodeles waltl]|uniref:Uncharacterized protein n=1 Tax=Pleurodeles waltl TaxID=8319 RepID=A0AAV7W2J3_PLEWA|nr:hypothetical protein NDU88_002675 [Pleurodeles waltl]
MDKHIWRNSKGQRRMKSCGGGDLPVVPDIERSRSSAVLCSGQLRSTIRDVALDWMLRTPYLPKEKALSPPSHLCTARVLLQK